MDPQLQLPAPTVLIPEDNCENNINFAGLECGLTVRNAAVIPNTSGDENVDYLSLEAAMASAANNRDHVRLQMLLLPLIELNDVEKCNSICALHWACFCGEPALVNSLLDFGCDAFHPDDINLETPVYFAIRSSSVGVVELLLNRFGTEVLLHENRRQMTPFLVACSDFNEDNIISTLHVLELLYMSGVSLEEQDSYGRTGLMHASRRGCKFVIQWLLSRGANLAHRDYLANTVLHHACHGCDAETLRFLCRRGAIGLVGARSIAATKKESTALGICAMKRSYLQYTLLKLWFFEHRISGRIIAMTSPYPLVYWILSVINFWLFLNIYKTCAQWNGNAVVQADFWLIEYLICQCLWFVTFHSDAGVAKRGTLKHHSGTLTQSFQRDAETCWNGSSGGPCESLLQQLQQQQLFNNLDIYRINNDSYKSSIWFPHAEFSSDYNDPLNTCIGSMEIAGTTAQEAMEQLYDQQNALSRETRAIYPQVALERQSQVPREYVDAIFGKLPISTVCITCNMVKTPRSHHCASCGVCMIRQDHHCAWVDNCIAKNNQRSFYLFIISIAVCILHLYYCLYFHLKYKLSIKHFDHLYDALHILIGFFTNAAWLAFVVYLVVRITRSMVTNVTFYEYLRKPPYIRARFHGNVSGKLWDFESLSPLDAFRNCLAFWTRR